MMSAATCLCFRVYQEMSDATVPKGASPQVYQTVVHPDATQAHRQTQWCQDLRGLRSRSLEAANNRDRLKCACHAHANER